MAKARIEISLQTRSRTVIRRARAASFGCCPVCGEAQMLLAEHAAAVCNLSRRAIYRAIEEGLLHFVEAGGGAVAVCLGSLLRSLAQGSPAAHCEDLRLRRIETVASDG